MSPRPNCSSTRRATRSAVSAAGMRSPTATTSTEVERRDRVGEMRRQRTAGEEVDLERAHEAHAIARLNPLRRFRIDSPHHPPQELDAAARRDAVQARAQLRRRGRARETGRA